MVIIPAQVLPASLAANAAAVGAGIAVRTARGVIDRVAEQIRGCRRVGAAGSGGLGEVGAGSLATDGIKMMGGREGGGESYGGSGAASKTSD